MNDKISTNGQSIIEPFSNTIYIYLVCFKLYLFIVIDGAYFMDIE